MTNQKHFSTTTIPMLTNIGRLNTYHQGIPLIKFFDRFITRSRIIPEVNKLSSVIEGEQLPVIK